MKLEVRLFAYFRDEGRGNKQFLDIEENETTLGEVIDELGIPREKCSIILINGKNAQFDSTFKEGDYVSLFPAVGGG